MRLNTKSHLATHEGAKAPRINSKQQLERSVLACLLWENTFYESGEAIADRITHLADICPAEFVAELAIKARNEYKLRHVPLLLLVALAKKGGSIVRETAKQVINRPDELSEVIAIFWRSGKKNIPRQLSKGIADSFLKFDEYQFSKWNRDGDIKLRDVMFLVHPNPQDEKQTELFKKIAAGTLAPANTWESRLAAGQDKRAVFEDLLSTKKLGYMALLRNLRGMIDAEVNHALIRDALLNPAPNILPFRFLAAAKHAPMFEREIDTAMSKVLNSVAKLPGQTIILVDVSGSMTISLSQKSDLSRMDAACGLSILLSGVCEHLRIFTFSEKMIEVPARTGIALADAIKHSQPNCCTYVGRAVETINQRYPCDRLIVITDEQSDDRVPNSKAEKAYMLNVASYENGIGYGPWTHINGFSEACVNFVREYEEANN